MKARLTLALLALWAAVSSHAAEKPRNIIMLVGDGMGPAYTTGYRYFADDKNTKAVETTVFDRLLVGMASTYPSDVSGYVTDSAAGATALATGTKTYNGAIGVDVHKQAVQSVLELAKSRGMRTGLAVTSQINHATPAAYVSHNPSRENYNQIADSYFDEKIAGQFKVDVMLGGGWRYFIRKDRDLVSEFKQAGYQYVDKFAQLAGVDRDKPLLGLFGDKSLPWAMDSQGNHQLLALVKAAVQQLENDKGFFLLVEASQIDWAGHGNDIASAMAEMHDLALALQWLEAYVDKQPDTLLVLTADHNTGGLSLGGKDGYRWEPQWLSKPTASMELIATALMDSDKPSKVAEDMLGFALQDDEAKALDAREDQDIESYFKLLGKIMDERSNTGWTTHNHTAVDVQVFAKGKGSGLFAGHLDNTQIAKNIFSLLAK